MLNTIYDVFFFEVFEEEEKELRKLIPKNITIGFSDKTIQETENKIQAKIISIRTQSIIPEDWLFSIECVLSRSTGYDHITSLKKYKHIKLGYLPLYCSRSVAEQAVLLWMSLLRKLQKQIHNFIDFNRDGLTGNEVLNKNLLVVGVGNIGSEICKLGFNLGMTVKGVDIIKKYDFIDYVDIHEGVAWADIIVCAMNLTQNNIGYFDTDVLEKTNKKPIFINISRGEFISLKKLLNFLENNILSGAGIDVYNSEAEISYYLRNKKTFTDNKNEEIEALYKLHAYDNCILTPHNSFNTVEALNRKSQQTVEQIKSFMFNKELIWEVV